MYTTCFRFYSETHFEFLRTTKDVIKIMIGRADRSNYTWYIRSTPSFYLVDALRVADKASVGLYTSHSTCRTPYESTTQYLSDTVWVADSHVLRPYESPEVPYINPLVRKGHLYSGVAIRLSNIHVSWISECRSIIYIDITNQE